ncbi:MAG: putative toxin-antitoxin system toxin component, PIN family [Spirosomaceae bacterium]|nr:putative toxin-antitoxin system toxin component, PIN family [Spirosomataceae bacterium]
MQFDKQRIILDTNVIVSALISNSAPTDVLYDIVLKNKVNLCLSAEVYDEYVSVLNRDKFSRFKNFKENAVIVLKEFDSIGQYYKTSQAVDLISDESDNRFLELALESSANYIITGNTQDFDFGTFQGTKIVTPRQYWEIHIAQS